MLTPETFVKTTLSLARCVTSLFQINQNVNKCSLYKYVFILFNTNTSRHVRKENTLNAKGVVWLMFG